MEKASPSLFAIATASKKPPSPDLQPPLQTLAQEVGQCKDLALIAPLAERRYPKTLPQSMRLGCEAPGPVEPRKHGEPRPEFHQLYDSLRKVGKISDRDAAVASLEPLTATCTKKKKTNGCGCSILTGDQEFQRRIREYYSSTVASSSSSNPGNRLLVSFVKPLSDTRKRQYDKLNHNRTTVAGSDVVCVWCRSVPIFALSANNHKWNSRDCPDFLASLACLETFKRVNFEHRMPRMSNDGMPTGRDLQTCVPMFRKLFNLGNERLRKINEQSKKPLSGAEDAPLPRGLDHKLSEKQKEELQTILEIEPRMSSHHAPQDEDNSRECCCSGGLSRFYFWTKCLETNDCESDTEFVAQCKRVNFWETHQGN
jgi:hypothetical protein